MAYYLHWPHDVVMGLDHRERRRWCREISRINKKLANVPEKNIFDV